MKAKDIVREILEMRHWSQSRLASESGIGGQTNVSGILNRYNSMRVDNLVTLVEAMGCEVVVRDKMGSGKEWKVTDGK